METETQEVTCPPMHKSKKCWVLSFICLIIIGALFAVGFFQLQLIKSSLSEKIKEVANTNSVTANDLNSKINQFQSAVQNAQELSQKQEQMIADWKAAQQGDLNKWYVAESYYLVKLANDHMQFTNNVLMTKTLLQRADQVLQNLSDTNLMEIRKAINEDIAKLETLPQIDVTQVYLQLAALDKQLDQLPFKPAPLKSNVAALPSPENNTWWQRGLDRTWEGLQKIVIVRNSNDNVLPLVLPEEKLFLNQNLHAQMQTAIWGLLHQNQTIFQNSLNDAITWINNYYDTDATVTKNIVVQLQSFQKANLQPAMVNIGDVLELFNRYLNPASNTPAQQ